jgi:hypothetical protein
MTIGSLRKALQPSLLGRSILPALPAALALVAAGSWQPAQALLTYNIFETSGGDVIVETSGSLNLGAPLIARGCDAEGALVAGPPIICTGPLLVSSAYALSTVSPFGVFAGEFFASSISGIATGFLGNEGLFIIDPDYVSGTPIVSSATFSNTTLAGLGFNTTGLSGTSTLADSGEQIRFVLTEVPGPLPLLGAGTAFGFSRRLRRRISASQATLPQA